MKALERLNWLQAEIDLLVGRYQKDSRDYKKLAFRLKIVSVLLAAIVTVLLGLKLENEALTAAFSNGAFVLSAAITVLSAYWMKIKGAPDLEKHLEAKAEPRPQKP
jgi:hypothetical protein